MIQSGKYRFITPIETQKRTPGAASGFLVITGSEINIRIRPIKIDKIKSTKNKSWKKTAWSALNLTNFDLSFWVTHIIIGAITPMFGIMIERCERRDISLSSEFIFLFTFTPHIKG